MPIVDNPARLLLDSGLLFAINCEILHPLGLALFVNVEDDGTAAIGGLLSTDDPEGITYGAEDLADGEAQLARFMALRGDALHRARFAVLRLVKQR
jgi:hypothetical protein